MKNNKTFILDEIKRLYHFRSSVEFARFLGIAPTTLSSWYARGNMDYDLVYEKCDKVDANWLLSGKGDMLRAQPGMDNQAKQQQSVSIGMELEIIQTLIQENRILADSNKELTDIVKEVIRAAQETTHQFKSNNEMKDRILLLLENLSDTNTNRRSVPVEKDSYRR